MQAERTGLAAKQAGVATFVTAGVDQTTFLALVERHLAGRARGSAQHPRWLDQRSYLRQVCKRTCTNDRFTFSHLDYWSKKYAYNCDTTIREFSQNIFVNLLKEMYEEIYERKPSVLAANVYLPRIELNRIESNQRAILWGRWSFDSRSFDRSIMVSDPFVELDISVSGHDSRRVEATTTLVHHERAA